MEKHEIKCVGVVVKPNHAEAWQTACELAVWLEKRGIALVGKPLSQAEKIEGGIHCEIETVSVEKFGKEVDLIVVLGGDGTMISTARLLGIREIPVLGINYGSLGYLTDFRIEEMFAALEEILAGNFALDCRLTLDVEHWRESEKISQNRVLNDVVINKAALARVIEIEAHFNSLFVNSFRADGLIVSTPTGSTAYNLSAGGPIVYPSMNAMVITPICPFTLSNRPLVIPDDAEVELILQTQNEEVAVTLDGQVGFEIEAHDCIKIRKSMTTFNLVQPPNRNYFDVLRDKLRWGR